jgi:hypothetical protein
MPPGVKKGKNGYTVTVAKRHLNLYNNSDRVYETE